MSFSTNASRADLLKQHSHRNPSPEAIEALRRIRQTMLNAAVELDGLLPPSRSKSLALTKLDECRMWACNAATETGVIREELEVVAPPVSPLGPN